MTSAAVLVTDGHLRPALAVVRSLGRAGYRPYVCSPRRRSLAGSSRYALADGQVPDPLSHPEALAEAVEALVRRWSVSLLLPISEEALSVLLSRGNRLRGTDVPFPPYDVFQKASDKRYVLALAESLGIATPEQVVVDDRDSLDGVQQELPPFPLVVKPARSVAGEGAERRKFGVTYAASRPELDRIIESLPSGAFPVLLQRRIEGPGTGVFFLIWESAVLALFAHRRVREKPPSGGVSVCAESVTADPSIVEQSRTLLAALNWRGPAMVEFKQESATGRYYLMEINGRFWGSLQLAIDAGVDFPRLLVAASLGESPTPVTAYPTGVRRRWWWGEVDHLLARLRGEEDPNGGGGRLKALRTFILPGRGTRHEVLRLDDPWPFVRESVDWFRRR